MIAAVRSNETSITTDGRAIDWNLGLEGHRICDTHVWECHHLEIITINMISFDHVLFYCERTTAFLDDGQEGEVATFIKVKVD